MNIEFATSSISGDFFYQLIRSYYQGISELKTGNNIKSGINGYCRSAISVYPLAVATWESFLYESILSHTNIAINNKSIIGDIPYEIIDKWDIITKSHVVPKIIYGRTFEKGSQPFQDFIHLVSIRNSLVHFKFRKPGNKTLNAINDLTQRNIFIKPRILDDENDNVVAAWTHHISTTEGIRWAINTISRMAYTLLDIVPEEQRRITLVILNNFKLIEDDNVHSYFEQLGVDPLTNNP